MDLWKKVLSMAIVGLCVGATQVHADSITLFNTGVLADGTDHDGRLRSTAGRP